MSQSPLARNSFSKMVFLLLLSVMVIPVLAAASGVHPLFNVDSNPQSPFPRDRLTAADALQRAALHVNLPYPNFATHPWDCADGSLLSQFDGVNLEPRNSLQCSGADVPSK